MAWPQPQLPARDNLYYIPAQCQALLQQSGWCETRDIPNFLQLPDHLPQRDYYFSDDNDICVMFWKHSNRNRFRNLVHSTDFHGGTEWMFGPIRHQDGHGLCWAYAAGDMVEAAYRRHGFNDEYGPFCPHYIMKHYRPDLLGTAQGLLPGHMCYGHYARVAAQLTVELAVQESID